MYIYTSLDNNNRFEYRYFIL